MTDILLQQAPAPQVNLVYHQPPGMNIQVAQSHGQLAVCAPDTAGTSKFDLDTAGAKTMIRHGKKLDDKLEEQQQNLKQIADMGREKRKILDKAAEIEYEKEKGKVAAAREEQRLQDLAESIKREKEELARERERSGIRERENRDRQEEEDRNERAKRRRERDDADRRKYELEYRNRQEKDDRERRDKEERERRWKTDDRIRSPAIEYPSTQGEAVPGSRRYTDRPHGSGHAGATFVNRPTQPTSVAQRSAAQDLYRCLMLERGSNPSNAVISQAYKSIALRHHPDKDAGKTEEERQHSRRRMEEITRARDILLNSERREAYDSRGIATIEAFREWQRNRQDTRR